MLASVQITGIGYGSLTQQTSSINKTHLQRMSLVRRLVVTNLHQNATLASYNSGPHVLLKGLSHLAECNY